MAGDEVGWTRWSKKSSKDKSVTKHTQTVLGTRGPQHNSHGCVPGLNPWLALTFPTYVLPSHCSGQPKKLF